MAALALACSDFVILPSAFAVGPNARPIAAARTVSVALFIVFPSGWGFWTASMGPRAASVGLPTHTTLCALADRRLDAESPRWRPYAHVSTETHPAHPCAPARLE